MPVQVPSVGSSSSRTSSGETAIPLHTQQGIEDEKNPPNVKAGNPVCYPTGGSRRGIVKWVAVTVHFVLWRVGVFASGLDHPPLPPLPDFSWAPDFQGTTAVAAPRRATQKRPGFAEDALTQALPGNPVQRRLSRCDFPCSSCRPRSSCRPDRGLTDSSKQTATSLAP